MLRANNTSTYYSLSLKCSLEELCPGEHLYPVFKVSGEFCQSFSNQTQTVIKGMETSSWTSKDSFDHEVAVFKLAPHPNIIKCLLISENVTFDFGPYVGRSYNLLVFPFLPADLFDCVVKTPLDESIARYYLEQLLDALEHLHKNGLAHRDIKLENILLDENCNLVLTDFGHAAAISDGTGPILFKKGTTPGICPPEYFNNGEYKGTQMDMFAVGRLILSLVTGAQPFKEAKNEDGFFKFIAKNDWKSYWSRIQYGAKRKNLAFSDFTSEFKDLVQGLLHVDPESRFTIEQVRSSAWFVNTKPCDLETIQRKLQLAGVFRM